MFNSILVVFIENNDYGILIIYTYTYFILEALLDLRIH